MVGVSTVEPQEDTRTVADLLADRAADDAPGLRFEGATWTWREVVTECGRRAAWLDAGPPHVGVLFGNIPEMIFLIGGAALSGHVIVALNPTRTADELARDAAATDCGSLLYEPSHAEAAVRVAAACEVPAIDVTGDRYRADVAARAPCLPEDGGASREPATTEAPDGATGQASPGTPDADVAGWVPRREAAAEAREAGRVSGREAPVEGCGAGRATVPARTGPVPRATLMLVFTSGTSGRPRAVRVTHRKIVVPGLSLAPLTGPAVYAPMPLFHSGALMAAVAPALAGGATLVLRRRFSASALLDDVRAYGCTYLHYVGKALSYVLATPERPGDADNPLRIAFGNEGSAALQERFGRRFGCRVIDAFGSTETAVSISPAPDAPPGALGRLPPDVRVCDPITGEPCPPARFDAGGRLLNPDEAIGELVNVAGSGLFDGYYNDPEADTRRLRDGRFHTGDYAYADAEGFCYFVGRELDRLRVDGENLAAGPIEEALRGFPGVVECAVYAVPDVAAGDQVMAALVLNGEFDPGAFAAWVRGIGAKGVPRYVRICAALPQTASNKILKRDLAREAWQTTDPVWHRPGREIAYRLLTSEDATRMADELAANGRRAGRTTEGERGARGFFAG